MYLRIRIIFKQDVKARVDIMIRTLDFSAAPKWISWGPAPGSWCSLLGDGLCSCANRGSGACNCVLEKHTYIHIHLNIYIYTYIYIHMYMHICIYI